MLKYKVWDCKVVVSEDSIIPDGGDNPPRRAAIDAVEAMGVNVLGCFSGWGGKLIGHEAAIVDCWVKSSEIWPTDPPFVPHSFRVSAGSGETCDDDDTEVITITHPDLDFQDLWPTERCRTYTFPGGETVEVFGVERLAVTESGNHRLETSDGMKHIVPAGWLRISIDVDDWSF